MSEGLRIREAAPKDIPALLSFYAQLRGYPEKPLSISRAKATLKAIKKNPNHRIFIACHEGKPVGTFTWFLMPNLAHRGQPAAVVENVVVDETRRGNGMGQKMMRFAMRLARAKKCYKLALSTNLRRRRAHHFYRALGFAQHGYSFQVAL